MRKGILTALAIALISATADAQQGQSLLPPMPEPVPAPFAPGAQPLQQPVPGPYPPGSQPWQQSVPGPFAPGINAAQEPVPAPIGPGTQLPPPAFIPAPTGGPVLDPAFAPLPDRRPGLMDLQQRGWATLDFLAWWVKPGPSPNPLVTTGSANDPIPGALGQPNTVVLLGEHNIDYGTLSGARVDFGIWLPCCPMIGIDAGFVGLEQRSRGFAAFSDANGDQVIARPVINALTGAETSYVDSYPGAASGGATVYSSTSFDSWEINAVVNMLRMEHINWNLIAGFRSLDLMERLDIQDTFVPLASGDFSFLGGPVNPPSSLADFDNFRTSNHFYGGQLGSKVTWTMGRFDVDWTVKVALGGTQQVITVDGGSLLFTPGSPPAAAAGGILAQPTNIGRYYHTAFSVVPETGLSFGYQITPWLRAQVGYNFLYWTNVVRPGDQIDRTVNPGQVPTDGSFGTLAGPARPVLTPQMSDFWAQGINFGLEFKF